MSTKQSTKRKANAEQQKEVLETVPKKMINVPAQNNNVGDQHGNADDQMPHIDATVNSRKLPDEVLQKFNNAPGRLLIAGNVAWDAGGWNNVPGTREELTVFHRFTDKKVSNNGEYYDFVFSWLNKCVFCFICLFFCCCKIVSSNFQ